ncbi:MAG: hypothetical protein ACOCZ8_05325 [Bacteroidota bacterium]
MAIPGGDVQGGLTAAIPDIWVCARLQGGLGGGQLAVASSRKQLAVAGINTEKLCDWNC